MLGGVVNSQPGLCDERVTYVTPLVRIDGVAFLGLHALRETETGAVGEIVGGQAPIPKLSKGAAQASERIKPKAYTASSSCQHHLGQALRRDRPLGSLLGSKVPGSEEGIQTSAAGRQGHVHPMVCDPVR
jgi:hypothetical protein